MQSLDFAFLNVMTSPEISGWRVLALAAWRAPRSAYAAADSAKQHDSDVHRTIERFMQVLLSSVRRTAAEYIAT